MANIEPFEILDGIPLTVYLGPVGEPVPDVDDLPAGNWIEFGETEGDQTIQHQGALTLLRTNKYNGPRKALRPEEGLIYTFTLVSLTLEHYARVLNNVANVVAAGGPPATKRIPLARGRFPTQYVLLAKAATLSPYAALPAQYVIPIVVFDGEPTATYSKSGMASLEIAATAITDDSQSAGDELGYLIAQTS